MNPHPSPLQVSLCLSFYNSKKYCECGVSCDQLFLGAGCYSFGIHWRISHSLFWNGKKGSRSLQSGTACNIMNHRDFTLFCFPVHTGTPVPCRVLWALLQSKKAQTSGWCLCRYTTTFEGCPPTLSYRPLKLLQFISGELGVSGQCNGAIQVTRKAKGGQYFTWNIQCLQNGAFRMSEDPWNPLPKAKPKMCAVRHLDLIPWRTFFSPG